MMIFDPFDNIVHEFAKLLGRPDDQIRLLTILFLAYPIGFLFRFLRGGTLRHLYSIVVGVILHLFMFRDGVIHFWGLGIAVYVIMSVMDRKSQRWVVFTVCLTHLSVMHIYRLLFDFGNWSLDATTFLMPLISRLSSLGFVYADGQKEDKDLTEDQKERKVVNKPSIVEILSYISFPVAGMCGPFFEFRDYVDFIEENGRYKKIPGSFHIVGKKVLEGIIVLAIAVYLPAYFETEKLTSDWFFSLPLLYQYVYWMIA